jgi:hypothetical protein
MTKPFQHLHLTRPLTMADLETTGLSPSRDRIVEIGAVKFLPSGERRRFRQRVNPRGPIPPAATEVHGITDADVADCPAFQDVARPLARFLRDSDLGGFNLKNFDLPFLISEFARVGISFPLGFVAVIDVQEIYPERERRARKRPQRGCRCPCRRRSAGCPTPSLRRSAANGRPSARALRRSRHCSPAAP